MKMRTLSIEYSSKRSRYQKSYYKKLDKEIQELEIKINVDPDNTIHESLNQKKLSWNKNRDTLIDGLLLRSRANCHENGENVQNIFAN